MGRTTGNTTLSSARLIVAVAAALVGSLLVWRGFQGAMGTLGLGGAEATVARIQAGTPVDAPLREKARTLLRRSMNGQAVALAGVVAVSEAVAAGVSSPNGEVWLNRAAADLRRGLSMSPANGLAWLRLASVESLLTGTSPAALSAFRMASYSLRNDDSSVPLILVTSMQLWPKLDQPLRAFVGAIVVRAWKSDSLRLRMQPLALSSEGQEILLSNLSPRSEVQAWIDRQIETAISERKARELAPPN